MHPPRSHPVSRVDRQRHADLSWHRRASPAELANRVENVIASPVNAACNISIDWQTIGGRTLTAVELKTQLHDRLPDPFSSENAIDGITRASLQRVWTDATFGRVAPFFGRRRDDIKTLITGTSFELPADAWRVGTVFSPNG